MNKKNVILFVILIIFTLINLFLYKDVIPALGNYPNSKLKSLLEIINLISAPLILIVTIFGLQQLKIAKDNSKLNAKRESYKLAAEQSTYYLEIIIPKLNKVDRLMEELKIESIGFGKVTGVGDDQIQLETSLNYEQERDIISLIPTAVDALNSIEGFSVFFTSRVAEDKIAYSSVGHTYCNSVNKLLPFVGLGEGKSYSNIVKLYYSWNNRIENEKAVRQKMEAEKSISKTKVKTFKSLGT